MKKNGGRLGNDHTGLPLVASAACQSMAWLMRSVIIPFAAVLILTRYVFLIAYIPSESMEPSIMTGDMVIALRTTKNIKRGDIIIFKDPNGQCKWLIKRVIGTGGDTVEIKKGESGALAVFINGEELSEPYLVTPMENGEGLTVSVPKDGFFVMGDNRNESYDARFWDRKIVYRDETAGIAKAVFWPIGHLGTV